MLVLARIAMDGKIQGAELDTAPAGRIMHIADTQEQIKRVGNFHREGLMSMYKMLYKLLRNYTEVVKFDKDRQELILKEDNGIEYKIEFCLWQEVVQFNGKSEYIPHLVASEKYGMKIYKDALKQCMLQCPEELI